MRGARTFISSLFLGAAALGAQVPDYFPLDVGNVWIYRVEGVPPRLGPDREIVEVTGIRNIGGRYYHRLTNYRTGAYWVRNDGAGRVWQYDESSGRETVWYDFTRRTGESYDSSLPTCCGRAEVRDTNATKRVALGLFEKVFHQITFPGVFQIGITQENFLPYVGLLYRSENTGGPSFRTIDLVYAKISGFTVVNASGIGFGLARAKDYARIFVNNNTGAPLRVIFSSGQTYDLTLLDASGKALYRWSDGKAFTQALRAVDLPIGETSWPVALPDIAGAVTMQAELVTLGRRFTATLPLGTGSSSRP